MSHRIAVTGHRPTSLGGYSDSATTTLLAFAITTLYPQSDKDTEVVTGMALGWDQAVAMACKLLSIPFIAALPFDAMGSQWPQSSQERLRELLDAAREVVVVSPGGFEVQKMYQRNEWMMDWARESGGECLALWSGAPKGGTYHAVSYAGKVGLPVRNLWAEWTSYQ